MPRANQKHTSASDENKQKKRPKHAAPKSKHSLRAVWILIAVIAIVFSGLMVYANNYDGILPNTYIADREISDMSDAELYDLTSQLYSADKIKGQIIPITCKTQSYDLEADSLNISYDNNALLNSVYSSGKDGNAFANTISFISRFFKPVVLEPVISYDHQVLADAFNKVTEGFETEPVGHTFVIGDNKVTIHGPVSGIKADRDKATSEAEKQIKDMRFSGINLEPIPVEPEPLDFDTFYDWLTSDAENAYYEKIDGSVIVQPSKAKCEVDRQTVKDAVENLKNSATNTVEFEVVTTLPETTSEMLTETLYSHQLSTYSTNYGGSSAARANNVNLAASRINGTELLPGEEFSYDKTILSRTAANGYMAAPVYVGNKVESGMGGGICQPSSTLYVAALYANLEIVERHNHSLKVSYLPPGLDATIAEGVLDLRFKNNTGYPIKINASADGGVLTFTIMGYNPDNTKVELLRSSNGATYYVTRVAYKNGTEVKREQMTSSTYGTPEEEKKQEEEKKEENKQEDKPDDTPNAEPDTSTDTEPDTAVESNSNANIENSTAPDAAVTDTNNDTTNDVPTGIVE